MPSRSRGIADGWLLAIVAAVILGLLVAAAYQVKSTIADADTRGYERGKSETEATYAKRDNDQLVKANKEIQELQNAAREREARHVADVARISDQYQREKANELAHKDRVIAGLRDGTTKLYVRLAAVSAPAGCPGAAGQAGSGTSGDSGAGTRGILDESDSAFLIDEANRADRIAGKLKACQAILRADRK